MAKYATRVSKIAKKLRITEEDAKGMIVHEHEMTNFLSDKDTVVINVDLSNKTLARFKRLSKGLKISIDSVAGYTLIKQLEREVK